MAQDEIHVGDVGTVFTVTIMDGAAIVNISTATVKQILYKKPDGTVLTKTADFSTNGSDGKIKYVTVVGDLDAAGTWSIQGYVEMPAGKWHSDISQFEVFKNL